MSLLDKITLIRKREKPQEANSEENCLDLIEKDPENHKAHMKLGEIYEKKGEEQNAISEYLLAADIFTKKKFYAGSMAIYKKLVKQYPSADHVYLKIADLYRKMGFLGDALVRYRALAEHYESLGMKDKAQEVVQLMAQMDPRKAASKGRGFKIVARSPKEGEGSSGLGEVTSDRFFDLRSELKAAEPLEVKASQEVPTLEKLYGIEDIFKELKETGSPSVVAPHFNYDLGAAYAKAGFLDDAIEQLQAAITGGQKPFEASSMLGFCYKKKGMLEESRQSFENALQVEGIPREETMNIKYELGLLYKELGRKEEGLKLLREVATAEQEVRYAKDEAVKPTSPNGRPEENFKEIKN
jgi:tetratricopeptide (TPR) repeat protein